MINKTCPCCTHEYAEEYLYFKGTDASSSWGVASGERTIFRCLGCGLQYTEVASCKSSPEDLYPQEYHDLMSGGGEVEANLSGALEQAALRNDLIYEYWRGGDLLDIGCSTGLFVKACQERGYICHGVDPSPYACQVTRQINDLAEDSVEIATIASSHIIEQKQFDIITLWDVIEHCNLIASDITKIVKALKPGGYVFLRTPDSASIFFSFSVLLHKISFGKINYPVASMYHFDHFLFFNKRSLSKFLEKQGLRVVSIVSDPLLWKRFKYAECRRSIWVNMALSLLYWAGRAIGHGHGMIVVARKEK